MARFRQLIEHANSLGVRVIGMPLGSSRRADWQEFERAAIDHPHILFVVSAGNNGRDIDEMPVYPAALQMENMIVVTSANDFVRPAERTNWGMQSVDFMIPAEQIDAIDFSGQTRTVSGSSYAVSRTLALAANLLAINPALDVRRLKMALRDLALPVGSNRYVGIGYIPDPLTVVSDIGFEFIESISSTSTSDEEAKSLSLSLLILDQRWQLADIRGALEQADEILGACDIRVGSSEAFRVLGPDYVKDLSTGTAHTVLTTFQQFRPSAGSIKLVFSRDSRMAVPFEAEAFGEGNTRRRPWMRNSVWLTHGARDLGITLAHEIFHILMNSGEHTNLSGNLMSEETHADNTGLTKYQCEAARNFF